MTTQPQLNAAPEGVTTRRLCRFCDAALELTVVDLGMSPPCELFLRADQLDAEEPFYPLHVWVCERCYLVQLPAYVPREEIFEEYAYFSSYSTSWVEHARRYVETAIDRLHLTPDSFVVEVASNDGYLLQHFGESARTLGIEPAFNVAEAARQRGVTTLTEFFGVELAQSIASDQGKADLILGNNVLAQVPDLHDFVGGFAALLASGGTVTLEFPHMLRLINGLQYDTIYHEHFSYFWFTTVTEILRAHGLETYDVEELSSHGGSLRVWAGHAGVHTPTPAVEALLAREIEAGISSPDLYRRFAAEVEESKRSLLEVLIRLRREGARVAGYGAPGKGNTLLNYCGIRGDFLEYTVDRNTYKHGRFTPGTHIPIHPTEHIAETRPDYLLVLPWNLLEEISRQLAYVGEWGAKLIVPIPTARIVEPGVHP